MFNEAKGAFKQNLKQNTNKERGKPATEEDTVIFTRDRRKANLPSNREGASG